MRPVDDKWEAEHRRDHTALRNVDKGKLVIAQQSAHHVAYWRLIAYAVAKVAFLVSNPSHNT
jgi:hypothetical protein